MLIRPVIHHRILFGSPHFYWCNTEIALGVPPLGWNGANPSLSRAPGTPIGVPGQGILIRPMIHGCHLLLVVRPSIGVQTHVDLPRDSPLYAFRFAVLCFVRRQNCSACSSAQVGWCKAPSHSSPTKFMFHGILGFPVYGFFVLYACWSDASFWKTICIFVITLLFLEHRFYF